MFKRLFEAVAAMLRAVVYLQILLMGAAITALGAYVTVFAVIRIAQLLHTLIFKEKWI